MTNASHAGLVVGLFWVGSLAACGRPASLEADHWALGSSCPGVPVIGRLESGGDCDLGGRVPPGWQGHVMFESGSPGVAALGQPPPPELQRYCSYQWQGQGDAREAFADLRAAVDAYPQMRAELASPDCHAPLAHGRPSSPALELAVELARRDAFRRDIDWLDGSALESSQAQRAPVEIAVADTLSAQVAADPSRKPSYFHGQVVGAIITDIYCPDRRASCVLDIRHSLAMPRQDGSAAPDWQVGGDRGTRGDVALAIYEAVEGWRERRLADPAAPQRLVLNLSLGWVPDPRASPLAPVLALEAALEFASCQGALVFVAAGNDPGHTDPGHADRSHALDVGRSGPLEPACFETFAAPTADECRALGFSPLDEARYPVFAETPRALVQAIGGVDGNDRALLNGRPGSRSQLAAPAMDGLAIGADGELTRSLSGSSIATAVASGAAALVWSYRPDLRPDEVVELLYASGWPTGDSADFGLHERREIHRIDVCAALARACESRPAIECPQLSCRAAPPTSRENRRALVEAMRALVVESAAERSTP